MSIYQLLYVKSMYTKCCMLYTKPLTQLLPLVAAATSWSAQWEKLAVREGSYLGKEMAVPYFHQPPRKFFLSLRFQSSFFGELGARKFLFGAFFVSTIGTPKRSFRV